MSQVTAGTVSVVQGSASVTATGVDWSGVPATAIFYIDGDARSYELAAAPGPTSLTLATAYQGITNPTSDYSLSIDFTPFLGLVRVGNQDIGTRQSLRQIVDKIDAWAAGGGGTGGGGGGTGGAVSSVFGRVGAVVAAIGDYTADKITDTASKVMMLATERTKLSGIATGAQVNPLVATTQEAQTGTDTAKMMTPATSKASAIAWGGGTGGGGGGGVEVQQFGTSIGTHPTINFFGNVSVADDLINSRTNIGVPFEAVNNAGTLNPAAIVITAEVMPYNPVIQSGPITFGLGSSTYNFGSAIFDFTSDGSAVTWNASLVFGPTGLNADLAPNFAVGTTNEIIVTFDTVIGKGRVYYGSSTDASKMPLAGGTFTGAVHLGTSASIISDVRNIASGLDLKDHALAFFDAGNVSGAVSLNYRNGTWQKMVAVGNITSITITNVPATGRLIRMWLQIHQDAVGGRTVAFGPSFLYPAAFSGGFAVSSGPSKIDVFDIATWDGGVSWLGLTAYNNFATAPYAPVGVVFDGSDYMLRSPGLTGAVNTTDFTFFFWMRLNGAAPSVGQGIFAIEQTATPGFPTFNIYRSTDNRLIIQGYNGTTLNLDFNTGVLPVGNIMLVMGSFGATQHQLYINNAVNLTTSTHNNVTRNFVSAPVAIGTNVSSPGNPYNFVGELSDLWFDLRLVDFTNATNRRKFTDSDVGNHIIYKGPNGELPFGTPPLIFCSGAAATWQNNLGSGGAFTLTGSLGTSSPAPIGA